LKRKEGNFSPAVTFGQIALGWQFDRDAFSQLCWHFLIVSCFSKIGFNNLAVIPSSNVRISGGVLPTPSDLQFFVC
jgi:hypothetical protein